MKMFACGLLLTFCITPIAASAAEQGIKQVLFDGKSLDRWHVQGCEVALDDGALLLKSGDGFVRTLHPYGDFILEMDWKALKDSEYDSGIYFRCDLPTDRPWPKRYQINLRQGQEGNGLGLKNATTTGLIKVGDWNHFKLTVIGSKATLEINGKQAWTTDTVEATTGFIGLQSEVPLGGQFAFKNIEVTELGFKPLFDAKSLAGWEETNPTAQCWSVEDGNILCNGQKGSWLRSKEQYGDFNLRLEYKLGPGGNSGIYVRVPADGDHHGKNGKSAGVEIQVLDDQAERYKNLKPYQYTGSVYAVAPAKEHVGHEAGTWNELEIDCQGPKYRIIHNGVIIVDATPEEFPELSRRQVEGFFGLQNHSSKVWYRNVRLGPSCSSPTPR